MVLYDYFYEIFYISLLIINLFTFFYISSTEELCYFRVQNSKNLFTFIWVVVLSLYLGFRPSTTIFGDTILYEGSYYSINENSLYKDEPLFRLLNYCFYNLGFSVGFFFSFVAFLYILFPLLYCRRFITRYNLWICFIVCISSFSFLGYGINGIRNGLAMSILIYAFSFLSNNAKSLMIYILLSGCAFLIHKSSVLPIFASLLAFYFVKDINRAIKIWILSIPVSLLFGSSLSSFIGATGFFDDRLTSYLDANAVNTLKKGFRWDFLLYSAMPIVLAYYVRNYVFREDRMYTVLMNTYIISNAFWIIIINANFSNRFAYLSWFLYPIIILYPLFCYKIWNKHNFVSAVIIFLYFMFTFLIWLRG